MPDEPDTPSTLTEGPSRTRTTDQRLTDIEALLHQIVELLKRDVGSGGLGH